MNKSVNFGDDLLKRYIKAEKIESAPAGFTEKVLTQIRTEKKPLFIKPSSFNKYLVPVVSGVFTLVLIVISVLLNTDKESAFFSGLKTIAENQITLPSISFEKISGIAIPGWIVYVMLTISVLSILDYALNNIFNRERK